MRERAERRSQEIALQSQESLNRGLITACISDEKYFPVEEENLDLMARPTPVDYYGNEKEWKRLGQKHGGKESYVISELDESDKFSSEYYDCIGLFAVGTEGNKNISILTHQDAHARETNIGDKLAVRSQSEAYEHDLRVTLRALKDRSESGTIDVVIFGGYDTSPETYVASVKLVARVSQEVLGVDPVVIAGPKGTGSGDTAVECDTQRRRIFIAQANNRLAYHQRNDPKYWNRDASFKASEVEQKMADWH